MIQIPNCLLMVVLCCLLGMSAKAQESNLKKKPKRLKREMLIYLNEVSDQPGMQLTFSNQGKKFRIDTTFEDLDLKLTVGRKLYEDDFFQWMKEMAGIYGAAALKQGYNRIVTHFYENDDSFPITTVYYIPGADFELTTDLDHPIEDH